MSINTPERRNYWQGDAGCIQVAVIANEPPPRAARVCRHLLRARPDRAIALHRPISRDRSALVLFSYSHGTRTEDSVVTARQEGSVDVN